jgi:poly(glycerol-phosphate) alpha-glucosyltransferase
MLTPSISRKAGGLRDCVLNLSRSLREGHDVEVDVLSVEDEFTAQDRQAWGSAPVHIVRPKLPAFRYSPELKQRLSLLEPDLLHVHGLWTYLSIVAMRWSESGPNNKPYLVSPHGMLDSWALRNSSSKKRIAAALFEKRHLERAFCLHAVNQAEALAIRNFGLKNPICVIPNGVKIPDPGEESLPTPWSAEFGNDRKVLLYLGRLHPKKGLPMFLRAWQKAISDRPGWILAVAGWDEAGHRAELEALVAQIGLSDSVKFVGPLFGTQRDAAYRNADAFVLPSLSEGQPLAVLEAWSHGLPVLMTGACNLAEGFEAGAAIQLEPTVESAIQALENMFGLTDIALQQMGSKGRGLVIRRFSWPQTAAQMHEVYRWILGEIDQPRCVTQA